MAGIISENINRARKLHEGDEGDVATGRKMGGQSKASSTKGTEGKKQVNGPKVSSLSPTVVDLEDGLKKPGLGPESFVDLDLEKEDVGLKEKTILWDFRSPTKEGSSLYDISLNEREIQMCRESSIPMLDIDMDKEDAGKFKKERKEVGDATLCDALVASVNSCSILMAEEAGLIKPPP
ncbi:hypothetical protein SESBI_38221 [Sesbania bispinosa]|nr:hypothetical protein SESBI_38221 [Sesbania bispinosa]